MSCIRTVFTDILTVEKKYDLIKHVYIKLNISSIYSSDNSNK